MVLSLGIPQQRCSRQVRTYHDLVLLLFLSDYDFIISGVVWSGMGVFLC